MGGHLPFWIRSWDTLDAVVSRSVARNVTGDSERPASSIVSPPLKVANGTASSATAGLHGRPKERPRSIGSQLEPLKAAGVKRTSSIRLEDISSPRLQSSTNQSVSGSRAGESDSGHGSKLQPTRSAPPTPVDLPPVHKPPQRPPPPCPTARDTPVPVAGNQYEEITHRSPTGPPPAPPDSRHRFYSSSQLPRQPAATSAADAVPATSVSNIRSKFEPVRSSSPGQASAAAQRHAVRRDVVNCSSVPAKSQTPSVARPQLAPARPSPACNESQC